MVQKNRFYFTNQENIGRFMNYWDVLLIIIIFSMLFFLGWTAQQMDTPYHLGDKLPLSLSPKMLPLYAARTVIRMLIALLFSIIFTFIIGIIAAKNEKAERIIIPCIDILQSVPVLSFLSITVIGFIQLFPGSLLGPECAAIFAIFTAQIWNIIFGFYQSLKTIPEDLKEAAAIFHLSSWQRFFKVELPFSISSLLWNIMMSMSASWFFVVLSEAITVNNQNISLPGIGSYIALAIAQSNLSAVGYAILTMIIVIIIYDQIIFRPLIAWSQKFKMEQAPDEEEYHSWLVDLVRRSKLMSLWNSYFNIFKDFVMKIHWVDFNSNKTYLKYKLSRQFNLIWHILFFVVCITSICFLTKFIITQIQIYEILHVAILGAFTALRVTILITLSSILWIPIGVWVGLRPRVAQKIQPIIQFAAAFPANLFYPLFVIAIVHLHLNSEIWLTPLMILGTQWYILFNVIAGASNIPRDLCLVADNFGVKGWRWWQRLALPGIFPFYITGAITAAGGAWNASIVAEWVSWGNTTLKATGLGEYIHASTTNGNFAQIALGTVMMSIYVLAFNHLVWRPLYRLAEERFHFN